MNHETFRDIRSAQREGAIGAAVGESRTVPRYFSCCQSRTFPMYISFWQLHSHLYLEKSRVIWDSAEPELEPDSQLEPNSETSGNQQEPKLSIFLFPLHFKGVFLGNQLLI